jgi:hypothetical protein
MTYEEKLALIIDEIIKARKIARVGQPTKIFVDKKSGLHKAIILPEIYDILLKLQDDTKILTIKDRPVSLKNLSEREILDGNEDHFLIDILDSFDDWYASYLMRQKSKPENLDWLNLLKILDVCSDIDQQIQMTRNTAVTIPSFPYPYIGRYLELFPYDNIGTRKSYQQHRWEGAQYLLKEGVAIKAKYDNDDVLEYGNIEIRINPIKFDDFYKAIKAEFEKRQKSADKKEEKPKTIDKAKVTPKVTYNAQKGELDIEGKKVKFKKDSFRAKLLELLLKDDKNRKKEWSWDEVIETIEDTKDEELTKENKNKFYPACDGLSKHIASKTGVNDLLTFTKSTVQINDKYL